MVDGLCSQCKDCDAIRAKSNYGQKRRDYSKEYRLNNKEMIRAKWKDYYAKNKIKSAENRLKRYFNITMNDYSKMLELQNGSCAICKIDASALKKRLAVDHCHVTGAIRGLLCTRCNTGIGNFKDNINILNNAVKYLTKENTDGRDD